MSNAHFILERGLLQSEKNIYVFLFFIVFVKQIVRTLS